jgi:hypothetical protein
MLDLKDQLHHLTAIRDISDNQIKNCQDEGLIDYFSKQRDEMDRQIALIKYEMKQQTKAIKTLLNPKKSPTKKKTRR